MKSFEPDVLLPDNPCYSRKQLSKVLCVNENTLRQWGKRDKGPSFFKVGKKVLYPKSEVIRWIESQMQIMKN